MFSMDFKPGRLQNGIVGSGYNGSKLSKSPVKIHAIMPSGPPHRICISLRTCKCKILCFGVVIFVLMLFILSNIVSYVRTPTYSSSISDKVCKVDEIVLQSDIDLERFEGSWYATYTKGMENKLLAYFLEFYDVKTKFTLKEDGNFELKSGWFYFEMSLVVRKPAFYLCENKAADQLRGNREADQRLCFRYLDSTIPLLPIYEVSSV